MTQEQIVSKGKNEITATGKSVAGVLLIGFTLAPIISIIGLWPDQMPTDKTSSYYQDIFFHMKLLPAGKETSNSIHINTLLFLLVALAGFMGSMIHLASSFTNYIGAGKFKKDWILWYLIKPFTAAGVAVVFYLVLQAGLLNVSSGAGINPYGAVILSALAGLFTDKATIKLEEVFEVLFKPKDTRPDKLENGKLTVTIIEPEQLSLAGENKIVIKGTGLSQQGVIIKMDGNSISDATITDTSISFSYKIDPMVHDKQELALSIEDATGKVVFSKMLKLQTLTIEEPVSEEAMG